jgi:hypothetical protein
MAKARYQLKEEPAENTIEKQDSSFLKHTTCTSDDGQLGRNM